MVAPAGVLAVGAAGDDDDDRGDFGVPAADFQPGVFQDLEDPAGRLGAVAVGAVPGACPLPDRVYRDRSPSPEVRAVRVPWSRS